MNEFNYTHIHLFDKSGSELPLILDPAMIIQIPNTYNDDAIFYAISNVDNQICEFYKKSAGGRYIKSDFLSFDDSDNNNIVATAGCYIIIEGKKNKGKVKVSLTEVKSNLSEETGISEYIISDIIDKPHNFLDDYLDVVGFPFVTFKSSLAIDSVSVDLIETQSLYVLIEENNEFIKVCESVNPEITKLGGWADRFKLLFFIDNRQQSNFRFFKVENDEAIWTDRVLCDLSDAESQTGYRVDIGFTGSEEGVYEQPMIVCLLDSSCNDDEKPGIIYPIGSITLTCEAIGEDERYRALFANFGIPDPINYQNTFQDTDLNEAKMDYKLLNEHSKYIFLTYKDTFPKAGSYGALAKAVSLLGYEDLIYKEWYKETGKDTNNEYVTVDVDPENPGGNPDDNTIGNKPIEYRISLKKLNWISIIYKLNDFLNPTVEDKYGFYKIRNIHKNYNTDIIIKLIYLKKWLEKHIIGLHCKIVDVGGEGIYLERYRVAPYGSYQQVLEWNNSKNLAPFVVSDISTESTRLLDSSAYIYTNVGSSDSSTSIEEIKNYRFGDFAKGYLDENDVFHNMPRHAIDDENIIYYGSTLSSFDSFEKYEIRAESRCKSFMFNYDFLTEESARLRVYDDELQFNPIDLLTKKKQSVFNRLPIIQLEKANIRKMNSTWKSSTLYKIYPDYEDDTLSSYFVKNVRNGKKVSTIDYVTLVPPEYREDDEYSYITPFGKEEYKIAKSYVPEVTSDNEQGSPYKLYVRESDTHGLRYTALNAYEIPLLCMIGYVCPELNGFIYSDEEYCLEILDGKLIFEDPDNSRTLYVNFHYDTESRHQSIELNIVYYSEEFSIVKYRKSFESSEEAPIIDEESEEIIETENTDNNFFYKFFVGSKYSEFVNIYKNNTDESSYHEYVHPLKVYNSGEFTVSVFGRDIYNNLFGSVCKNVAYIGMPDVFITGYSNYETEQVKQCETIDMQKLNDSYENFCIFKPDYLIHDLKKTLIRKDDNSAIVKFTYPSYSYSSHNVNEGDFLHFMNLSDRYLINAIDIKTYLVQNDEDFAEYNMLLQKYTPAPKQRVLENNDYQALTLLNNNAVLTYTGGIKPISSTDFIKTIKDNEYYNFSDINFILYNELANTVIIQTPGSMINDKAIPYVDASLSEYASLKYTNFYRDQYRLFLGDDSYKSYVWAILETTSEESIPKYLSNYSYEAIDTNIGLPYEDNMIIDGYPIDSSDFHDTHFELEETNLYNVSSFLIDLFKTHNDFVIPTSDSSTSDWDMESHFSYLFDSLQTIKDIDIPKQAQSIEDIIERNELYSEKFIRDGIELLLDGPTKEESSLWFNLYFELKSNLIKTNYDLFKDIATDQIYNIFARKTIYSDLTEEERFGKKLIYRLMNVDAAMQFEANDLLERFLNYIISYDEIEDDSDPGTYLYANIFLLTDAIRAMQVFSTDEYLLTGTIHAVIDALNTHKYENKEDYLNICKSIYYNIYKNFMKSESDIFGVVNSVLMANDSSYNVYNAVLDSVTYNSSNHLPESFNIEIGKFGTDLYYPNIENYERIDSTTEVNGHEWTGAVPTAAKLQNIIHEFYNIFLKGQDEILTDPEKYGEYYTCIVYVIYCYFGLVIADYIFNNGVYKIDSETGELVDNIHTDDIIYKSDDIDNIFIQYVSSDIYASQNEAYILTKAFANGLFNYIFGIYEETTVEPEINEDTSTNEESEEPAETIITVKDTLISGLLKEKSSSETTDEFEPLYNKLLNNLIQYDTNYLKSINWVTTTTYVDDKNDRYYGQIITLYAVAAGDPLEELLTNLYYVKLPGYEREGYIFINRMESVASSIGNLEKIIETPYITPYIQPTWKAQVIITILSNRNAASMGFDVEEGADPDEYSNYMAIEYFNKKFTHAFNKGEMIKLIFESVENNEYVGQSSYEVVGYDISKKFVIVKGTINPAYIRKTGYEVWAKVKDCETQEYSDLEVNLTNQFKTYVEDINKLVYKQILPDYDGVKTTFSGINAREILKTYVNEETETELVFDEDTSTNKEVEKITTTAVPYSLPVKYWWDDDDIDYYNAFISQSAKEGDEDYIPHKDKDSSNMANENPGNFGSWFYQVMIYQNGTMYPVESSYTIADEMVNVYVSYAHNAYADYVLKATDFVEKPDGYSEVYVNYEGIDIRKCDFIDDTFALSIRDYDTNIGMAAWMNRTPVGNKDYVPNILTTELSNEDNDKIIANWTELGSEFPLYKLDMHYVSREPKQIVLNRSNTNVAFDVNFETTEINKDTATVFWRIYKENLDGTKKRLFDSYNTTLFLDIDEPGNYDIEAFACDTYGNVASTYYNAAIKIV